MAMNLPRPLTGLLALLLAAAGVAGTRAADAADQSSTVPPAPEWSEVTDLGRVGGFNLDAVVAPDDTVTVVGTARAKAVGGIFAIRRSPDGRWQPAETIGWGTAPQVVADRAGNVTVVWQTHRPGWSDGVRAATRTAGGSWSEPVRLSVDRRLPRYSWPGPDPYAGCDCRIYHGANMVEVAVAPGGLVLVTWSWGSEFMNTHPDVPDRVQLVQRRPGRAWSEPTDLTGADESLNAALGAGPGGSAVAAYVACKATRTRDRCAGGLEAIDRTTDGAWSPAVTVAQELDQYFDSQVVDAVVADDGAATIVYLTSTWTPTAVASVHRPAGEDWSSPVTVSEVVSMGDLVTLPSPASVMDGAGRVTVSWVTATYEDGVHETYVATMAGESGWAAPQFLAQLSDLDVPDGPRWVTEGAGTLAVNDAGDLLLTTTGTRERGSYRTPSGDWSRGFEVAPRDLAVTAVLSDGTAVVLWRERAGRLLVHQMTIP